MLSKDFCICIVFILKAIKLWKSGCYSSVNANLCSSSVKTRDGSSKRPMKFKTCWKCYELGFAKMDVLDFTIEIQALQLPCEDKWLYVHVLICTHSCKAYTHTRLDLATCSHQMWLYASLGGGIPALPPGMSFFLFFFVVFFPPPNTSALTKQ